MSSCGCTYLFNLVQIYQKFLEKFGTEHAKTPAILEKLFHHMSNLNINARNLLMANGKFSEFSNDYFKQLE